MREEHYKRAAAVYAAETAFCAVAAAWCVLPFFTKGVFAFSPLLLPFEVAAIGTRGAFSVALAAAVSWPVPALALWKLAGMFLHGRLPRITRWDEPFSIGVDAAASAMVLLSVAAYVMHFAVNVRFFATLPVWNWALFFLATAANAISVVRLIGSFSARDEGYQEYRAFRKSASGGDVNAVMAIVRGKGIQKRLTLSFTAIIFVTVTVLSAVLLGDFGATILGAVTDSGKALAERTSSVMKSSLGDRIAQSDYIAIERGKNESAAFPFSRLSFYRKNPRTGAFSVQASTDTQLVGTAFPDDSFELAETGFVTDDRAGTVEFRAPVSLSGVFLGFVAVSYRKDVILEPYFRTKVKVIVFAVIFVYASFFITYMFGRNIVFPILFLRMSVNSIATSLASMMQGKTRVSADLLRYRDRVETKDEIKQLSEEVGNMAAVIRGVIPYISASTLKHADRAVPSSERRNLAFMFTDIRGFTTLCEGHSPEEVVALLNKYLEIQADAIAKSGGDIDKFVGDEVMAVFDGPQKELHACRAAMAIRKAMAEERERAVRESRPPISIGIGINTGPVVFGSVGARDRMDFTSIGDTVNLAARLEGANKTYGSKTLVTEAVWEKVREGFLCREIDLLTVKGKTRPARIYEIVEETAKAGPRLVKMASVFEEGLRLYRERKWASAEKAFGAIAKAMEDGPSEAYLRRIALYKVAPPPPDWDGVFELTAK